MIIKKTSIDEVLLITPKIHHDERGYFYESFNNREFLSFTGKSFVSVQDNHSFSKKGTLRGIHFQVSPMSQAKVVQVVDGQIYDVAVDLRKESSSYGTWVGEYLSAQNHNQLYIPEGFGHGFVVISDIAKVSYKVNNYYSPEHERCIRYDDPKLNIEWPTTNFKLSDKDSNGVFIDDQQNFF